MYEYMLLSLPIHTLVLLQLTQAIRALQDLTFAQITVGGLLLGAFRFSIPSSLADFTMTRLQDDSWDRRSAFVGISTPEGNYILRQVVTGNLQRAKYYDQWVKQRGGRDFFFLDYA